jgi:hypothetical protein
VSDEPFGFGENWRRFLDVPGDERIAEAERSVSDWLGEGGLLGKAFLDAGCGGGLISLASLRLGAQRVATPVEIFALYRGPGFELEGLRTCGGGLECNEFVFRRGE